MNRIRIVQNPERNLFRTFILIQTGKESIRHFRVWQGLPKIGLFRED